MVNDQQIRSTFYKDSGLRMTLPSLKLSNFIALRLCAD
jgi:hypothetical protein